MGFGGFFCFKNSGFVFNERVKLYFYDKRVASHFSATLEWCGFFWVLQGITPFFRFLF
jgi:hypothetical protein